MDSRDSRDEREAYLAYEKGKEQAEASGLDALLRDVKITAGDAVDDVKDTVDGGVDEVDKDLTGAAKTVERDVESTTDDIKNELKADVGIGNSKASRFDEAASGKGLTDNIKEPDKDEEVYVSRKRARYQ